MRVSGNTVFMAGYNKWILYNVNYGDRESWNFRSIENGNERGAQTRRFTVDRRLAVVWQAGPAWSLFAEVIAASQVAMSQG